MAATAAVFRRDLASFWQPLDWKFVTLMLGLAADERVSLVSFFWSSLFFSYLDYTPELDRLPYAAPGAITAPCTPPCRKAG